MTKQESILQQADKIINGERHKKYGDVIQTFKEIAEIWSIQLNTQVKPIDVAACMISMKLIRAKHSPNYQDNWLDIAGYSGLADKLRN